MPSLSDINSMSMDTLRELAIARGYGCSCDICLGSFRQRLIEVEQERLRNEENARLLANMPPWQATECRACGRDVARLLSRANYASVEYTGINARGLCQFCVTYCVDCGTEQDRPNLDDWNRCSECTITCEYCGERTYNHLGDTHYGECCAAECRDCETVFLRDGEHESSRCPHCREERERQRQERIDTENIETGNVRFIYNHDWTPSPLRFRRHDNEKAGGKFEQLPYLGLEIEMEYRDVDGTGPDDPDVLRKLIELEVPRKDFYAKHDGSLTNGCEIVSYPMSWAHLSNGALGWTHKAIQSHWSAWNSGTCGLHIHVSRAAVSKLEIYKLLKLFDSNQQWVLKFSKRKPADFRQWASITSSADGSTVNVARYGCSEKYRAINLRHRQTLEFRIFRGTLKRDSILVCCAFVLGLIQFARETSLREFHSVIGPGAFSNWVKRRGNALFGKKIAEKLIERIGV